MANNTLRDDAGPMTPVFGRRAWVDDSGEERRRSAALARRAGAGDRDAFEGLYARYSGNVYRHIRGVVRDSHEAEDITQQVFLKLMSVLPQYEEAKAPFGAWILRVARNMAIDHLRRRQPVLAEEVFSSDTAVDETARRQLAVSLRAVLDGLPDAQRQVILLREVRGMQPREIAQHLDKTEGSVHALLHRAHASMKIALVDLDAAPTTR